MTVQLVLLSFHYPEYIPMMCRSSVGDNPLATYRSQAIATQIVMIISVLSIITTDEFGMNNEISFLFRFTIIQTKHVDIQMEVDGGG